MHRKILNAVNLTHLFVGFVQPFTLSNALWLLSMHAKLKI